MRARMTAYVVCAPMLIWHFIFLANLGFETSPIVKDEVMLVMLAFWLAPLFLIVSLTLLWRWPLLAYGVAAAYILYFFATLEMEIGPNQSIDYVDRWRAAIRELISGIANPSEGVPIDSLPMAFLFPVWPALFVIYALLSLRFLSTNGKQSNV